MNKEEIKTSIEYSMIYLIILEAIGLGVGLGLVVLFHVSAWIILSLALITFGASVWGGVYNRRKY